MEGPKRLIRTIEEKASPKIEPAVGFPEMDSQGNVLLDSQHGGLQGGHLDFTPPEDSQEIPNDSQAANESDPPRRPKNSQNIPANIDWRTGKTVCRNLEYAEWNIEYAELELKYA